MPISTHSLSNRKLSFLTTLFNYLTWQSTLMRIRLIWIAVFVLSGFTSYAQDNFFIPAASSQARLAAPELGTIEKYSVYLLKTADLRTHLAKAPLENRVGSSTLRLDIPLPNGTTETFTMVDSPILSPSLAAQNPDIRTYTGRGVKHPTYTIRLSLTSSGFDAIVLGVENSAVYITKVTQDITDQRYITYFARDVKKNDPARSFGSFGKCGTLSPLVSAVTEKSGANARAALNNTGTTLRTFRLALSATKEFTQQKGGGSVDGAFNAIVGYVNRMNAVYRVELSVAFTLVSNKNTIFTTANDGGLNNRDLGSMLDVNQTILDNAVGDANYDVGHVLGNSGGSGEGLAQAPAACISGSKAKGATSFGDGSFAPVFDDQTFSHEVGHQFSMSHTYNSTIPVCTTREPKTSVEPGAGTTIMSYGYTCSDSGNPARNDDYETPYQPFLNFHTVSYQQAAAYINTLSCFTTSSVGNAVPVINNFPSNVSIPKSTPFQLSATATDANAGDQLTYSWEGTNIGTVIPDQNTLANRSLPPFFRSYVPVSTGMRMYPRLDAILNGSNYAKGDKLPSVGIATTHTLTVRDNVGGVTYQSVTVTIDGNSGPFLETTNLAGKYPANSAQTITWSVANTTAPPVNCSNVNILLSTDGGQTFPITLAANTANDGNETITFPDVRTTQGRIRIESSNNIFFDISNANFSISDPIPSTGAPVVQVTSTDPSASEGNTSTRIAAKNGRKAAASDPGIIQFARSSSQGTLVVNYQIGGTATNGVDFVALPTSVTFADGQSLVTEEVDPIEDDIVEGDETIVITLLDSDNYDPDPNEITTTVTIKDNDVSRFAITGVTPVSCETISAGLRQIAFSPQYEGQTGQPINFSVVNEMASTTRSGPYTLRLYTDNPVITLKATQNGASTEASFVYNWLVDCNVGETDKPPFAIADVTMIDCQTISSGVRRISFYPLYTALTGQPVSFSVVNEMASTTNPGPYTLNLYTDNPVITLKATQSGTSTEASFAYNWLLGCNATITRSFAITSVTTVDCQSINAGLRRLTFNPNYSGQTGEPISFSVVNEMLPTNAAGPYMLNLYTDNPVITLKATQSGTPLEASFMYNWLSNCVPAVQKVGVGLASESVLSVQVLGNPIRDGQVRVEVQGAIGQPLQLSLLDVRGQPIVTHSVEQSGKLEQHTFDVSRQAVNRLILRVNTPTQSKTIPLLKAE